VRRRPANPPATPAKGPAGSDNVDALLSLFPGPVTLWPNRLRILGALALALILIALVLVGVLPPFSAEHQMIYLATFVGMAAPSCCCRAPSVLLWMKTGSSGLRSS
jgi:hypothetical protein